MSFVNLTRFALDPENPAEGFSRVQATAEAMSQVDGVIGARAFATGGSTAILFVEHEDFATIDRIRAHDASTRHRVKGLSTLQVSGQEWWSGAPTYR